MRHRTVPQLDERTFKNLVDLVLFLDVLSMPPEVQDRLGQALVRLRLAAVDPNAPRSLRLLLGVGSEARPPDERRGDERRGAERAGDERAADDLGDERQGRERRSRFGHDRS